MFPEEAFELNRREVANSAEARAGAPTSRTIRRPANYINLTSDCPLPLLLLLNLAR
jgi:hypothetical protein